MQAGAGSTPDRNAREEIEDRLREAVERASTAFKTASPEQKRAAAERLREACGTLMGFVLQGKSRRTPADDGA
jgi:hypothetical protein